VLHFFRFFGSVENIPFNNVLGGFAPATVATPFAISVENRFGITHFYPCVIRDFFRTGFSPLLQKGGISGGRGKFEIFIMEYFSSRPQVLFERCRPFWASKVRRIESISEIR